MNIEKTVERPLDRSNHETKLSRKAPGSPFAFVALSYPVLLCIAMLALATAMWLV